MKKKKVQPLSSEEGKLSRNRPESLLTNPPGHLWRDKWTALSGRLLAAGVAGPAREGDHVADVVDACR